MAASPRDPARAIAIRPGCGEGEGVTAAVGRDSGRRERRKETLADLFITYRGVVYPSQCDHMGHMNVTWYVGKFDEATWQLFAAVGLTRSFLRAHDAAMAGVQQNIAYRRELYAGETITVRSGVLELREKAIRFCQELRHD